MPLLSAADAIYYNGLPCDAVWLNGERIWSGAAPVWSPRVLFVNGEQGWCFDPCDLSNLYEDAAGTAPVTAIGQPVGLMLDFSGNGNHRTQITATARPTRGANGLLHYDGVDDRMASGLSLEEAYIELFEYVVLTGGDVALFGITNGGSSYNPWVGCIGPAGGDSTIITGGGASGEAALVNGKEPVPATRGQMLTDLSGGGMLEIHARYWTADGVYTGAYPGFSFPAQRGASVLINRELTEPERVLVRQWIASRHGLTLP